MDRSLTGDGLTSRSAEREVERVATAEAHEGPAERGARVEALLREEATDGERDTETSTLDLKTTR